MNSIGWGDDKGASFRYTGIMSTRVILVSRGMFHDGLVRVLEDYEADVQIIGSAETWAEAKVLIPQLKPEALIADHQFAEEMMADLEQMAADEYIPEKILFIILDENKIIVYQRQQMSDITVHNLLEAL